MAFVPTHGQRPDLSRRLPHRRGNAQRAGMNGSLLLGCARERTNGKGNDSGQNGSAGKHTRPL